MALRTAWPVRSRPVCHGNLTHRKPLREITRSQHFQTTEVATEPPDGHPSKTWDSSVPAMSLVSELFSFVWVHSPSIELLKCVCAQGVQDAQEVHEYGFPYSKLELVHDVRRVELPVIHAVLCETRREGTLDLAG